MLGASTPANGDDDADDGFDFFQSGDDEPRPEFEGSAPPTVPPRLGLLAKVTTEEFDAIARAAQLKHLDCGVVVFEQGDEADRFFILVDGYVAVERDDEVLATLGPGSFFGESALLVEGRRSATIRTLAASSIWSVDYATFGSVVSSHLLADDGARREVEERIEGTPPESFR